MLVEQKKNHATINETHRRTTLQTGEKNACASPGSSAFINYAYALLSTDRARTSQNRTTAHRCAQFPQTAQNVACVRARRASPGGGACWRSNLAHRTSLQSISVWPHLVVSSSSSGDAISSGRHFGCTHNITHTLLKTAPTNQQPTQQKKTVFIFLSFACARGRL